MQARGLVEGHYPNLEKAGKLVSSDPDMKGHHMTTVPAPTTIEKVDRPDGVDMYGLYVEAVVSHKMSGEPRRYLRLFLVNKNLYVYDRYANRKSAVWRTVKRNSHDEAAQLLKDFFDGKVRLGNAAIGGMNTVALRGEPVLVQLRATDVLEMEKDKAPASRYVGAGHVERNIGKFLPENWKDTAPTASPASLSGGAAF